MDQYSLMVKGVVRHEGKYLVVQRWYDDCISTNPYRYGFCDGRVQYPEGPDAAVLRIVKEATGLDVTITKCMYTWSFMSGDICNVGIAYECASEDEEVVLSEELSDYQWVEGSELGKYIEDKKILYDLEKAQDIEI